MSSKTYRARVVVLRKTKLREKDLIVTMLDDAGMLRQAVAKGARKPGGSYAARLELFSVIDGWFAEGKSLDVVTDAKLVPGSAQKAFGLEQAACASAVAELVCCVAQEGLPHERLFEMTTRALSGLAESEPQAAMALTAADMLKTLAMAGFKPSFDECVSCGNRIGWPRDSARVLVSIIDGGVVCGACGGSSDAISYDSNEIAWARALMGSTFNDVLERPCDLPTSFALLQLIGQWVQVHVGKNLKSVDYLLTCGLF